MSLEPRRYRLRCGNKFFTVRGQGPACVAAAFLMATRIGYEWLDDQTVKVWRHGDPAGFVTVTKSEFY